MLGLVRSSPMTTASFERFRDLQRAHGLRALKYASVSVVGIVVTQILLVLAYQGFNWGGAASNFFAVTGASVPAYILNRRWVWQKSGQHSLRREVLPFWGVSLLGLILSTVAVGVVTRWWDSQLVLSGTNIAAFGVLWVGKYMFLDKLMFGNTETSTGLATEL